LNIEIIKWIDELLSKGTHNKVLF